MGRKLISYFLDEERTELINVYHVTIFDYRNFDCRRKGVGDIAGTESAIRTGVNYERKGQANLDGVVFLDNSSEGEK